MANKFTKSVLERQAKEMRQHPVRAAKPAGEGETAAPPVDLTEFIVRDEGRMAKNKTFYLDAAVIDALHRAAVAQKVTDSKLVNDILRKILGL